MRVLKYCGGKYARVMLSNCERCFMAFSNGFVELEQTLELFGSNDCIFGRKSNIEIYMHFHISLFISNM